MDTVLFLCIFPSKKTFNFERMELNLLGVKEQRVILEKTYKQMTIGWRGPLTCETCTNFTGK